MSASGRDTNQDSNVVGIGPFEIEEHVSSGGMGHVYRARRTTAETTRRVAIKVLRASLDSEAVLARFSRERTTLRTVRSPRPARWAARP